MTDHYDDPKIYAPVLERMVEILGAEGNGIMTFDTAIKLAARELGIEIPEHMRGPLLVSAFRIMAGGRLPGAPDA